MGLLILWAPPEPTLCPWPWLRPPFLSTNPNPNLFFFSNIPPRVEGFGLQTSRCGREYPTQPPEGYFLCSWGPLSPLLPLGEPGPQHPEPARPNSA